MTNEKITVLGGGASGLMSAITAARAGAAVTLIEGSREAGRKILATGNGRCNYSNRFMASSCYHSSDSDAVMRVIKQFDVDQTVAFFCHLGIGVTDRGGYLYPRSNQASTIREALVSAADRAGVEIILGVRIEQAAHKGQDFVLFGTRYLPDETAIKRYQKKHKGKVPRKLPAIKESFRLRCKTLILTTGGSAAPAFGSDGTGYALAANLGHHIIKPVPALVPLTAEAPFLPDWHGVRTPGHVMIFADDRLIDSSDGELQLTKNGISGIPVFQVSAAANRALSAGAEVKAVLDFLPDDSFEAAISRADKALTLRELLHGLFPAALAEIFLKLSDINGNTKLRTLSQQAVKPLETLIHGLTLMITGSKGFDFAQVTAGGVAIDEVDLNTMASKRVPQLFFAGEILDVDGLCGGYNLQWCWSSGYLAGLAATGKVKACT